MPSQVILPYINSDTIEVRLLVLGCYELTPTKISILQNPISSFSALEFFTSIPPREFLSPLFSFWGVEVFTLRRYRTLFYLLPAVRFFIQT